MASVSYSMTRGVMIDNLAAGSQAVTAGTSAPGAGDIEIRVDLTKNLTKLEIREHLETIWRFIQNAQNVTAIPL